VLAQVGWLMSEYNNNNNKKAASDLGLSYFKKLSSGLLHHHIPDDEDRDGPRNVGFFYSSDEADRPRRFY
jgi:hypothetical protein